MKTINIYDNGWKRLDIPGWLAIQLDSLCAYGQNGVCAQQGPEEKFACSRKPNHKGPHVGHIDNGVVLTVAAWKGENQ